MRHWAEAPGHPSNSFGHYYLGIVAKERKSYGKASERLHRAIEILEASVGRRSPSVAILLNALASIECKRHRFAAALELSREAVSICEEALGPRHRETGAMLLAYAEIQDRLHFHDEARQNKAKAVAIARPPARGGPLMAPSPPGGGGHIEGRFRVIIVAVEIWPLKAY